jgi:hypothetical protein
MPIKTATAPPDSLAALTSTLQSWVTHPSGAPGAAAAGISFAAATGVDIKLPHPVYDVGLKDLAAGKGLTKATLVSWRYLLSDGESTSVAEVSEPRGKKQPRAFAMLNRGPFVASLVETVENATKNKAFAKSKYELAVLHIPALYVLALWLRSGTKTGKGVVIPLAPAPAPLTAGKSYSEEEFVAALAPAAKSADTESGPALAS